MTIDVEDRDGIKIVRPQGELGSEEGLRLIETVNDLLEDRGDRTIIDLSGVPRINSAGISALVRVVAQANTQEQTVALASPVPLLTNVFAVTRLDKFFTIFQSVDQACTSLRAAGGA